MQKIPCKVKCHIAKEKRRNLQKNRAKGYRETAKVCNILNAVKEEGDQQQPSTYHVRLVAHQIQAEKHNL